MRAGSSKGEVCCHSNEHSGNRNHGHGCPEPGKKNFVLLWLHRSSIVPYISIAGVSGGATRYYADLTSVLSLRRCDHEVLLTHIVLSSFLLYISTCPQSLSTDVTSIMTANNKDVNRQWQTPRECNEAQHIDNNIATSST